jgi:hypothetical protein
MPEASLAADFWINQGYSVPIDPTLNAPIAVTDFHLAVNVTASKAPAAGNPGPTTVPSTINGGNAAKDKIANDPQFMPPAVNVTPGVPAGGMRTDGITLDWNAKNNPVVFGPSGIMKFGAKFVFDKQPGAAAVVNITQAQWSKGAMMYNAKTKAGWNFTLPQNQVPGAGFSYTDDEGPETLSNLSFASRPDEIDLSAYDPTDNLGGNLLTPNSVLIDGAPVSPGQSSFSLNLGDTISFSFAGDTDPNMTVQGLQTYSDGSFGVFAVEDAEVVPEPSCLSLLVCGVAALGRFASSSRRLRALHCG